VYVQHNSVATILLERYLKYVASHYRMIAYLFALLC